MSAEVATKPTEEYDSVTQECDTVENVDAETESHEEDEESEHSDEEILAEVQNAIEEVDPIGAFDRKTRGRTAIRKKKPGATPPVTRKSEFSNSSLSVNSLGSADDLLVDLKGNAQEGYVFGKIKLEGMADIVHNMSLSLETKDASIGMKKERNLFQGDEAADFLFKTYTTEFENRQMAVAFGQALIDEGFIEVVGKKAGKGKRDKFKDKDNQYRIITSNADKVVKPVIEPKKKVKGPVTKTTEEQKIWEEFSAWLTSLKFRNIDELPKYIPVPDDKVGQIRCPGLADKNHAVKGVTCLRRFNSRKVPHMIEIENVDGEKKRYIYKQDDDISMDVAVMDILKVCNKLWKANGLKTFTREYDIVSCSDLTGFGEIVPGDTMLGQTATTMLESIGNNKQKMQDFYYSLVAVCVTTYAFDITDRHHNNVMFCPDGDIALIDLSASLGKAAPLDSTFKINPVYYPSRVRKVHHSLMSNSHRYFDDELNEKTWIQFEADCTAAYFAICNSEELIEMCAAHHHEFPQPWKFLFYLHKRQNDSQGKEHARNIIVEKMDNSNTFNSFVAGVTKVLPIN